MYEINNTYMPKDQIKYPHPTLLQILYKDFLEMVSVK